MRPEWLTIYPQSNRIAFKTIKIYLIFQKRLLPRIKLMHSKLSTGSFIKICFRVWYQNLEKKLWTLWRFIFNAQKDRDLKLISSQQGSKGILFTFDYKVISPQNESTLAESKDKTLKFDKDLFAGLTSWMNNHRQGQWYLCRLVRGVFDLKMRTLILKSVAEHAL